MTRGRVAAPQPTTIHSRKLALLAGALLVGVAGSARAAAPELTREGAVATALANHPEVTAARARVGAAEGRLVTAGTYPSNPELELEGAARVGEAETAGDFSVGIAQELELGGQLGRREEAARADLRAARAERRGALRRLVASVHLAFTDALEAREALAVARDEAALAAELLELARRRLSAGATTQLDVNVAAAELGRTELAVGAAVGTLAEARAALAEALALPAGDLPLVRGDLTPPTEAPPPLAQLVLAAERHRGDLLALAALEDAARARAALARAEAWPSLRIGVFAGREAGSETLVGARVSIPLPVFDRNQGGIAEADAAATSVGAQRAAARLTAVREVVSAHERYRAELAVLATLRERVIGSSEENLTLLKKAFEAGKSDWTDVLVMQRTLFDARRALVASSAQALRDRLRLEVAAGTLSVPGEGGAESGEEAGR